MHADAILLLAPGSELFKGLSLSQGGLLYHLYGLQVGCQFFYELKRQGFIHIQFAVFVPDFRRQIHQT